jgi:hypothetical protein
MSNAPRIYIASPYTTSDLHEMNRFRRVAVMMSERVVIAGGYPISPVLISESMGRMFCDHHQPAGWWYAATLELLHDCAGVFAWSNGGRSIGVRGELMAARRAGIPTRQMGQEPHRDRRLAYAAKNIVSRARKVAP